MTILSGIKILIKGKKLNHYFKDLHTLKNNID